VFGQRPASRPEHDPVIWPTLPIEGTFRDHKSAGWQWGRGQVVVLAHVERLLVAMALATWLVLLVGTDVGRQLLARAPSGCRQTRPYAAKRCLFTLGLQ
jgi:hypothetical protein